LHEETPGNFDFETGFLNLPSFLKAIKEADMFAVYRPGPFICGEWELGGYPAWLLRDPHMKFRSNYKPLMEATEKYFAKLFSIINEFEFSNGGPIIALQLENEYGGIHNNDDLEYITFLKNTVRKNGFKGLLFTSDPGNRAQKNPESLSGIEQFFYESSKDLINF
jgi:beta-galactosidase GanA